MHCSQTAKGPSNTPYLFYGDSLDSADIRYGARMNHRIATRYEVLSNVLWSDRYSEYARAQLSYSWGMAWQNTKVTRGRRDLNGCHLRRGSPAMP